MIPKTEIIVSACYNYVANDRNFNINDLKNLKKKSKKFERYSKKTILKILRLIPKYSGVKWNKKYIPIYILKTEKSSFAIPLTLKFREEVIALTWVLIHELVHNNLDDEWQLELGDKLCEQYVNLMTKYVEEKLRLDFSKIPMKNFNEIRELNYDLNKKPLIKYIKNKKQ